MPPPITQEGSPPSTAPRPPGALSPRLPPSPAPLPGTDGDSGHVRGTERFMNTGALPDTPFFPGDALTQWPLSEHRTPLQGGTPLQEGDGTPLLHPSFPSRSQFPGANSAGGSGLAVAAETCPPKPRCGPPHRHFGFCPRAWQPLAPRQVPSGKILDHLFTPTFPTSFCVESGRCEASGQGSRSPPSPSASSPHPGIGNAAPSPPLAGTQGKALCTPSTPAA